MFNGALSEMELTAQSPTIRYLGPATVRHIDGRRVQLECPDEFPWATLALAQNYQPEEEDVVLAIGSGDNWYVIGVIDGHGRTSIVAPGDLENHAPAGRIDLLARDGIHLQSGFVEIVAEKLELTARRVFERFSDATQWVTEALHMRVGRMDTTVEGLYHLDAEEIIERAEKDVTIDGKMIHLA